MFLYLVQHAEAARAEVDPARDLTSRGRTDIGKVANFVGKMNLTVDRIWHSGKTRARRTAEILAQDVKPAAGSAGTDGLAPLEDPAIWAGRLAGLQEDTMLVGHLPHLARLATLLLCGDTGKTVINFKMGGMVCLRLLETGGWAVEWMLVPEIF